MHSPKKFFNKKLNGFTLTELLVVLVIIGILVLLALPNLMPLISKSKSTEAKLQLEHVFTLQKTFFYEHSKYSDDLSEIGFEQEKLTEDGGNANYVVAITASDQKSFTASARAVVDFDSDGTFNIWEIDQNKELREVTPD